MRIINLKTNLDFLEAYVNLRNQYVNILLTKKVNIKSTREWIKNFEAEIILATQDNMLHGACILHIYRQGEITIFSKKLKKGVGRLLLSNIEKLAKKRGLKQIWAWTDINNISANKLFVKNEFMLIKQDIKEFKNKKILGNIYIKDFIS